jgi:hypothetical protein
VPGRNPCSWFVVPLCTRHHQLVTRAYYNADPNMMKPASNLEGRIRRAREGCHVLVKSYREILNQYLYHPECKFAGPDGHPWVCCSAVISSPKPSSIAGRK